MAISKRVVAWFSVMAAALAVAPAALAAEPKPWELGMQPAATEIMARIHSFYDLLLIVITVITVFVLALLIYVMVRFSAKRNPTPTRTTHNTMVEVLWTVIPVIILVVIAVPSFRLLYFADVIPKADLTVKAVGHQWYWSYEYPDHGAFTFDSVMVPDTEIKPGQIRLLSVDNRVVVPVGAVVRVIATAQDVLHSWTVPSFGVKIDAVPGRLNETWFKVEREGVYYGQCSELCGNNHGFMPIAVEAVGRAKFDLWVQDARRKFARADEPAIRVAASAPQAR